MRVTDQSAARRGGGYELVEVGVADGATEEVGAVLGGRCGLGGAGCGDGGGRRGVEAGWEEELCLFSNPGETVDPLRGGGARETLAEAGGEVVAVAGEEVVGVACPEKGHCVDEVGDLGGGEGGAADEDCLAEAGVRGVFRLDLEDACVRVWMATVAVFCSIERDTAVVETHAKAVEIPIYCGNGVRIVRVLEVIDV